MSKRFERVSPVVVLGRWSGRVVAVLGGAASVLALAPFFVWPVLFLTVPLLVWLIDGAIASAARRPAAHAAAITWWFAFGYFMAGLFWIGEAFLVEADKFALLMPVAVTLMPAGLGLFWAAAAAASSVVWTPGWTRVLALTVTLSAAEWLRGHVLTGFPWNVIGYALTAPDAMMQSAAVFGIYGLTLIAVPLFAFPLVVWQDARRGQAHRGAVVPVVLAVLACLVAMAGWGGLRLQALVPGESGAPRVRIVQPSIPQREKWQREKQSANFEKHLVLTTRDPAGREDGARDVSLVVWPEAAMPFLPLDTPQALAAIGRTLPAGGVLAAGLLRIEMLPTPGGGRARKVFNSLGVFGADGRLVALYDKIHLVPFGEYLPFQATLEAIGLEQLTRVRGGFTVGPAPRPLMSVAGLPPLGPLICYEVIFPAAVVQGATRPGALLNVTNDGWFGNTTGPRQHFHQARVRAVEEGLPLIRAANNGLSAMIDGRGRIVAGLGLDVVGTVDARLPPALPPTLYVRYGDGIFGVLWLGALAVLLWRLKPWHLKSGHLKPGRSKQLRRVPVDPSS